MNNFYEKLSYSLGHQQTVDCNILRSHIPKCIGVEKTSVDIDRAGVDYIATLQGGTKILIDAKTRTPGCSRYWKDEPELAIETWSVVEKKIPGWTFNEKSDVDYILYIMQGIFLYPFSFCGRHQYAAIPIGESVSRSIISRIMGIHRKQCLFLLM